METSSATVAEDSDETKLKAEEQDPGEESENRGEGQMTTKVVDREEL